MLIRHIDDVLSAIDGRKDFVIAKKDGYIVVDYLFSEEDTFDDPYRRECRGIKFDPDGKIIARPFQKFFNVGERPDTQMHTIEWNDYLVMEKLDGSMIHPAFVDGRVEFMTRMGMTDVSEQAHLHAVSQLSIDEPNYFLFCELVMNNGYTPIFEWTSPQNRIVIRYAEPQLTLLAMRDMESGVYVEYSEMAKLADDTNFRIPYVADIRIDLEPKDLVDAIRKWEHREGIVVKFASGKMVKVKAEDYVLKHRTKDQINLEKNVLQVVLEGQDDDLASLLDDDDAESLREYATGVRRRVVESAKRIELVCAQAKARGADRRSFAVESVQLLPKILRGPAFSVWNGDDPLDTITKIMKKYTKSQTTVDSLAPILKETRWKI